MSLRIVFTPHAWQEYDTWLRHDTKMARRISRLILDIQRDPHGMGLGKPELLKGPPHQRRTPPDLPSPGNDLEIAACPATT